MATPTLDFPKSRPTNINEEEAVVRWMLGDGTPDGVPHTMGATAARFDMSLVEVAFLRRKFIPSKPGGPSKEEFARFMEKCEKLWALTGSNKES